MFTGDVFLMNMFNLNKGFPGRGLKSYQGSPRGLGYNKGFGLGEQWEIIIYFKEIREKVRIF